MTRLRPLEVRLVASLLQEPAEDAEELAGRIIEALDESREKRDLYVVVARAAGFLTAYGPFGTRNQGLKLAKDLVAPGHEYLQAVVRLQREAK